MTTPSFAHHVFRPWHAQGDRRIVAPESRWREPLAWNLAAEQSGERVRVLVGCEVFEDWIDRIDNHDGTQASHWDQTCGLTMSDVRQRLFDLIAATPHLDWLIATEKPENVLRMMPRLTTNNVGRMIAAALECGADCEEVDDVRNNMWMGTIVSTQAEADARIPALLKVPAAVRWVWCRGMKEEVRFGKVPGFNLAGSAGQDLIRNFWVAVSGPTGLDARPTDLAHIRSVVRQGQSAGVPVWVDNIGDWPCHAGFTDGVPNDCMQVSDGGRDMWEWPSEIRVRQLPEVGR
jgi:protein gp37